MPSRRTLVGNAGSERPVPVARTLPPGILPFDRSMLASLRNPCCARPSTPSRLARPTPRSPTVGNAADGWRGCV